MRYSVITEQGPFPTNNGPKWVLQVEVEPPSLDGSALISLTRKVIWDAYSSHLNCGGRPGAIVVLAYYQGDDLSSSPTATRGVLAPFGDLSACGAHYPDSVFDTNVELMPAHLQPRVFPCRPGDLVRVGPQPTPLFAYPELTGRCGRLLPTTEVEVLQVRRYTSSGGQDFRVQVRSGHLCGWIPVRVLEVGKPFTL